MPKTLMDLQVCNIHTEFPSIYSAFTETGATQTKKTNQMVERKQ